MTPPSLPNFEKAIFQRLKSSKEFSAYEEAFRLATGLPLRFLFRDEDWCLREHHENQSPFCEAINECHSPCRECIATNQKLIAQAEVDGPLTCGCFSGMCATAVPVKLGNRVIGYLKTGQVFQRLPTEADFERTLSKLEDLGFDRTQKDLFHDAYFKTKTVEPKRYRSMVLLLETFADQLTHNANQLVIILDGSEPESIARARKLIHAKLDESISLGELARAAGLSESHFCRTFKEVVKMTVTEYITRARINWARKELLRPAARISDIAFQVGFQSLSQFNRSFAKVVGSSPSKFRETELSRAKIRA